ncbi:MAG TPA: hypothetical protein VFH88_13750, partial [Candidatus Krumholzibacteria bacterium]|nr:hypothetical protein [Candidatus Krumholzibacteria bacterium]
MKRLITLIFVATAVTSCSRDARAQEPPPPPPSPTPVSTWHPTAVRHSSDRTPPSPPQIACVLVWRGWGEHGAEDENG